MFFSRDNPRILLLIGDEGILCLPSNVPGAPAPFFADDTDECVRAMLALAARHPRVPVILLADTLAQDLRRDSIPRLNPFDRAKLVRRRLQQAFPHARLTGSLKLRASRGYALLAGLQDGTIFDWLARFAAGRPKNPPQIALLPIECAGMIARLLPRAAQDWALLITRQRTGGFRQIVAHKGELVFTRLTPPLPQDASPQSVAESIARDIQATRGYLGRLGLSDRDPLPAVLLLPEDGHAAIRNMALPLHDPLLITPHEAARLLGLSFAPALNDPYGDVVCAGWVAQQKRLQLPLMPDDLRQARRRAAIRRFGWRAAAAMLLLALGLAGRDASGLADTFLAREKEAVQLAALKKELIEEQTIAAPVTAPIGRLREALERQRLFNAPMPAPWAALEKLNKGLGNEARLVALEWKDDSSKASDENLRIEARLVDPPDMSDREATDARFRHIAANVAEAMPGYSADVTRLPFAALPQEALSNGATSEKKAEATVELSIRSMTP